MIAAEYAQKEEDHGDDDKESEDDARDRKRLIAEKRTHKLHTEKPLTGTNATQPTKDNTASKAVGNRVNNWLTDAREEFKRRVRQKRAASCNRARISAA